MTEVDTVTLGTIWHFLQRVCREVRETIERTATNIMTVTVHDLAYGIWDAKGRAVAIPEGICCRLLSTSFQIRAVLQQFGEQIFPGDVFLTNHPFRAGAVHWPDWVFVKPIFYEDELVFFACVGTHVPDNGGAQPGAYFLAVDNIAEGLNIPPIKLVEKGQMRQDVLEFILCNNRLADTIRREIYSLIGSISIAERRLLELLNKYGKETVLASVEEMISRMEKAVRADIAKWPDGTFYGEAQTEDDGLEIGVPVTIRCKLTIKGDEVTFDFSESDEQRKGYVNLVYPTLLSSVLGSTFLFLDPSLVLYHNEGSMRPIHVTAREGTVVNCTPGSLVAASPSSTGEKICLSVWSALSQALPHRAITPYGSLLATMFIGQDPKTNKLYVNISFGPSGGAGAVWGYDGYQSCCVGGTFGSVSKANAEEEMLRFPWRITRYEFTTDSAGAGKWRGAPGISWEAVNEGPDCMSNLNPCEGWHTQQQGQQGGYPTPFNRAYILRGTERIDIAQPHTTQHLKAGDIFVAKSGGGAGLGPPEERDPEAVKIDVKNELVSIKAARDIYKVVLDPESLEIDYAATQIIRSEPQVET
jgi:N-methylhydantoinase B